MKKKLRPAVIISVCVAVVAAVLIIFLLLNPQYTFAAGEYLGINCKKADIVKTAPEALRPVSLDELKGDSRVRFGQSLMLVNKEHPLPDGFSPELAEYRDTGVMMNACMTEAYATLSAAVTEKTGERLLVSSDYRTYEQQKEEYDASPTLATVPGASEHQTGLALDVYVPYYASYGFLKSEAGRFVDSECRKYGFIIRYPVYGEAETGIAFEPWHIRYVGEPHANIIYNNRLTLEEYISSLEIGAWYEFGEYLISRQEPGDGDSLQLPEEYGAAVISPDNMGGYIITVES